MRKVIMVRGGRFDLDSVRPQLEAIVGYFDRYLDEYPAKTARSKHAVMGPVATVLERAATRQWDAQALTGYALRVHEMNPNVRGFLSPAARQALEVGTERLVTLCRQVPVTAVAKVVERVDYGLYYARRAKSIEWLEKTRLTFAEYLSEKYNGDFPALVQSWGQKDTKGMVDFTDVHYPSHKSDAYKKAGVAKQADTDQFWQQYLGEAIPEEGDND